jgi:hypothetical protein
MLSEDGRGLLVSNNFRFRFRSNFLALFAVRLLCHCVSFASAKSALLFIFGNSGLKRDAPAGQNGLWDQDV